MPGFCDSLWERACSRRLCVRRRVFFGVHIHCCGNGRYWFRPYGESLFQTPKRNQKALPHHSVPRLGSACPHSGHRGLTGRLDQKPKRGGLIADLALADARDPLWERACSRRRSTITRPVWMIALSGRFSRASLLLQGDEYIREIRLAVRPSSRAGSLPQRERRRGRNQVGFKAASLCFGF